VGEVMAWVDKIISPLTSLGLYPNRFMGGNQSLQTMVRATGTLYTNDTGKPIVVYFTATTNAANGVIGINVNGFQVENSFTTISGRGVACSTVVPAGATYEYAANLTNPATHLFRELR
jgi:hypothetical protein